VRVRARARSARDLRGSHRGCPLMPLAGCSIGHVAGTTDLLICRSRLVALCVCPRPVCLLPAGPADLLCSPVVHRRSSRQAPRLAPATGTPRVPSQTPVAVLDDELPRWFGAGGLAVRPSPSGRTSAPAGVESRRPLRHSSDEDRGSAPPPAGGWRRKRSGRRSCRLCGGAAGPTGPGRRTVGRCPLLTIWSCKRRMLCRGECPLPLDC
jgi:hypothetical protein